MMLLTSEAGLRKSLKIKTQGKSPGPSHQLELRIVNIVVTIIQEESAPHMGRIVRHVVERITLQKCRSRSLSSTGNNKCSFKYRQINVDHDQGASSDEGQQIDEITSKVKSLYYNDVHFNSVNTQMHISLSMKSCNGNTRKTCFKVDNGGDGNLLPLAEFFKHFLDANLNDLARTADPNTKLYTYK